ncbi:uncharacterized protein SPPG_07967 [Spizellomyces punctatus DAOM BR117]|uniref:Uncharacterized protein n=1 Tax=Spizellomyces punctatus (strain DAOM BR117) TaxID=645134 RepID=A0A0L0H5H6_SPIPD|nr:uncharacterized protein SPPG_07967 [Spizellomyces punctatus DAOM BR117]KNC96760.1 hypothetical protein SPPG_07967 [Spizellomyces punctatus DAOM BR117]|eukprot:XP_016604800.1 hypothetical protein SPPG_07967 [Spizellomyces punctatus DAOM BR117]
MSIKPQPDLMNTQPESLRAQVESMHAQTHRSPAPAGKGKGPVSSGPAARETTIAENKNLRHIPKEIFGDLLKGYESSTGALRLGEHRQKNFAVTYKKLSQRCKDPPKFKARKQRSRRGLPVHGSNVSKYTQTDPTAPQEATPPAPVCALPPQAAAPYPMAGEQQPVSAAAQASVAEEQKPVSSSTRPNGDLWALTEGLRKFNRDAPPWGAPPEEFRRYLLAAIAKGDVILREVPSSKCGR